MNRRGALLWLAVAAPIAAWSAQLLLVYFLVSLACAKGVALPLAWHAVSLAAGVAAAGALVITLRLRPELPFGGSFVAQVASLGAAVFLLGIVFFELPLILLRGCG